MKKLELSYIEKELLAEKLLEEVKKENFVDVDITIDEIVKTVQNYNKEEVKMFLHNLADLIYNP